jgi:hypothetical protein
MAGETPYPGAVYQSDLRLNPKKLKAPYVTPPYSAATIMHVGMIALLWGTYETRFNRLLNALIIATEDTSEPHWKFLDYKRRRQLCRKLIVSHFRMRPHVKNYLVKVLDDSAAIQNDRNAILHGKCAMVLTAMPDTTMKTELMTAFRLNGKEITKKFTDDALETIGHDILHITGRLNLSFSPNTSVQGLSSLDMRALEALLSLVPHEAMLP